MSGTSIYLNFYMKKEETSMKWAVYSKGSLLMVCEDYLEAEILRDELKRTGTSAYVRPFIREAAC